MAFLSHLTKGIIQAGIQDISVYTIHNATFKDERGPGIPDKHPSRDKKEDNQMHRHREERKKTSLHKYLRLAWSCKGQAACRSPLISLRSEAEAWISTTQCAACCAQTQIFIYHSYTHNSFKLTNQ